ncbi:TPA: hypothetical protein ACPH36_005611 [Pseudomonas aeruginosa]
MQVLEKVEIPLPLFNRILTRMVEERIESGPIADAFFREHRDIWLHWVPEEVAQRLDASLK